VNDRRVAAIRSALELVVESLDAATRIARWDNSDPIPDSLRQSSAQLAANMKAADKLAQGSYSGTPAVVTRLSGISSAIRRLSAAYTTFQERNCSTPEEQTNALVTLDADVDDVRSQLRDWD